MVSCLETILYYSLFIIGMPYWTDYVCNSYCFKLYLCIYLRYLFFLIMFAHVLSVLWLIMTDKIFREYLPILNLFCPYRKILATIMAHLFHLIQIHIFFHACSSLFIFFFFPVLDKLGKILIKTKILRKLFIFTYYTSVFQRLY